MGKVWIYKSTFTDGTDGNSLDTDYSTTSPWGGGYILTQGTTAPGMDGGSSSDNAAFWNTSSTPEESRATLTADQYCQVEIRSTGLSYSPGAMVRCADDGFANGYLVDPLAYGGGVEIGEVSTSSWSLLASGGGTVAGVGDTIEIRADGTTISGYFSGGQEASVTDSTHASGDPGLYTFGMDGTDPVGDNFEAGNLTGKTGRWLRWDHARWRRQRAAAHRARVTRRVF